MQNRRLFWACLWCLAPFCCLAQHPFGNPDSLRQVLTNARPEARPEALFQLGFALQMVSSDSLLHYANALQELYQAHPQPLTLGFWEELLGTWHGHQRRLDRAAEHFRRSATAYANADAPKRRLQVLNNLTFLLVNTNRAGEASAVQYELLRLASDLRDTTQMIEMLHQLSMLQSRQKLFAEAIHSTRQAYQLETRTRASHYFAYSGFAKTYENWPGKIDSARHFYQKALETALEEGQTRQAALEQFNLGRVAVRAHNYAQAHVEVQQALNYFRDKPQERILLSKIYVVLGQAQCGLGQYTAALQSCEQALHTLNGRSDFLTLADLHEVRARAWAQQGDYTNAYHEMQAWRTAADSVVARERAGLVADIAAQYRTREQQVTIADQTLQLERTRARNRLLLAGTLIALLLGSGVAFAWRQNRRQTDLELRLRNAETTHLRDLDRTKSAFFANISHEFRTPLTLILSPLNDLLGQRHQGDLRRTYAAMARNAERLLGLVNQLLDLSRLESGKLQLHPEVADLAAHLRVTCGSFETLAAQKQIDFVITLPNRPLWRRYDRDKLEQMVVNLLGNAFKFTPENGRIEVMGRSVPAPGKEVESIEIQVVDTGIGIPEQELPRIFERFYQVENPDADGSTGSGIGLALTKELVSLMGGQIVVKSSREQGSTFQITLPLEIANSTQTAPALTLPGLYPSAGEPAFPDTPTIPHASGKAPLVLVAEDNPDVRAYLCEHLRPHYHVLEAQHGQEALTLACETTPDLVLTDLMMPEMNGVALTQHLKQDARTSHIPVVMLTAKAERTDRLTGIETGAEAYLTKPVDSQELLVVLANLLKQRKLAAEKYSQQVRLGLPVAEAVSLDEQFLQQVLAAIEARLDDEFFGVEQLASAVSMSRSNLFRKLNALTGKNPNALIRELRLQRAKELLEQGAGNVSEVAFQVGFNSRTYFARCFTEHFGAPPSDVKGG